MRFSDLLDIKCIDLSLVANEKEDVIHSMVAKLADAGYIQDIEKAQQAVIERENALSTGVGQGVAVPHATLEDLVEPRVAFARTQKGVSFNSIDGEPVHLVFLLLAPENEISLHLKLLSRVSRLCYNPELRQALMGAESAEVVMDVFRTFEAKHLEL